MKLRRARGAPFTISRSCQPNAIARAHSTDSPLFCQVPSSSPSIVLRTVRGATGVPSARTRSPVTEVDREPQRGISAVLGVRKKRPVTRRPRASGGYVFHWPFGPLQRCSCHAGVGGGG